jgi:putative ATPase
MRIARAALGDRERGYGEWRVEFEDGALEHLVEVSDGDARSLLNALELAVETSAEPWPPVKGSSIIVGLAAAEESIQRRAVLYDKDGDYHYDAASALIKSLRGSDPDAALYWLARMVYAGEDPRFAFRRMLISACEDVGLADPSAVQVVLACARAFDRVGMPEGQYHLAHAALYLATAPKSNSALGYFDALASVEAEAADVPSALKDANRDAKGFGHGEGYLYPHAYRDHWVAQQYLPDSLRGRVFYQPGSLGLEGERRRTVLERREAQLAGFFESSMPGAIAEESFAWSEAGEGKREWRARAEGSAPARLALVRGALYDIAAPSRSDRVLVLDAREGYLVWEALRRCPEGSVAAAARNDGEAELIAQYATTLPELERPLVAVLPLDALDASALEAAFGFSRFDHAVGRDLLTDPAATIRRRLACLARALPGATLTLAQVLPREGGRISELFAESLGPELAARLGQFEEAFYSEADASSLGPGRAAIEAALGESGFDFAAQVRRAGYPRRLSGPEVESWLSTASPYGSALAERLSARDISRVSSAIAAGASVDWPVSVLYVRFRFPS